MYLEKIRLQKAMTQDINHYILAWETPGLHVEAKVIPKNATVRKTFVLKLSNGALYVGVELTVEESGAFILGTMAKFSILEELQKEFPNLFELDGNLYVLF